MLHSTTLSIRSVHQWLITSPPKAPNLAPVNARERTVERDYKAVVIILMGTDVDLLSESVSHRQF